MKSNAAFLISQPRAGSTMLQHILSGHPEIGTAEEPWLLLPLLSSFDPESEVMKYGGHIANVGNQRFFDRFSKGTPEDLRRACVRAFAKEAYSAANSALGTKVFLDKTPRYYLIIDEILETFPDAKVILLLRNPCAVFTSIVTSWIQNILLKLQYFKVDFQEGPEALSRALKTDNPSLLVVRYEDIVVEPDKEIERILAHLGIPHPVSLEQYGSRDLPEYGLGDHKTVYRLGKPDPDRSDRWVKDLKDPQVWRLTRDYFRWLETQGLLSDLGYDSQAIVEQIESARPPRRLLWTTVPLSWLLDEGSFAVRKMRELIIRLRCKMAPVVISSGKDGA